jgi:hypothetical protein
MAVDSANGSIAVRGKHVMVVQRPARLRVEVLGFLNQTLAVVVTDGDRFEVLRTQDRSYEAGELRPTLLWDEARIALTPEEAISVLLGIPLPDPQWVPSPVAMDPMGLISIELADTDGARRQRLSFGLHGYLTESQLFDAAGRLIWRAHFDDYREIDGDWLAHAIELDVTTGTTHAEISLSDVELNPVLSEDLFRLRLPGTETAAGEGGFLRDSSAAAHTPKPAPARTLPADVTRRSAWDPERRAENRRRRSGRTSARTSPL